MDLRQPASIALVLSAVAVFGSGATWAACRWWYARKLSVAAQLLDRTDKARLFSQQQTMQARRQIEQLKTELGTLQQSAAESDSARRRAGDLESRLASASEGPAAIVESGRVPLVSAHGFADTQVL